MRKGLQKNTINNLNANNSFDSTKINCMYLGEYLSLSIILDRYPILLYSSSQVLGQTPLSSTPFFYIKILTITNLPPPQVHIHIKILKNFHPLYK